MAERIKVVKVECDELGFAYVVTKIPVDEVEFKERFPVALEERAEKYAELLKKGVKFPPIHVFGKRFKGDTYLVFDGHARLEAHKRAGFKEIEAIVVLVDENGNSIKCDEVNKIKRALERMELEEEDPDPQQEERLSGRRLSVTWAKRIKDLLVKVTLYQYGKYPAEKLDRELTEFLKAAEGPLCKAIRRNGGICYKELIEEEFTQEEALEEIESQAKNFETLSRTGKIIADLLRLSAEFRNLDKMALSDKVFLFDKIVHAEHAAGAFKEYLAEEKSIFGVDITRIKGEADKEVEEILKGKEKAPDPQEDRALLIQAIREAFRKIR